MSQLMRDPLLTKSGFPLSCCLTRQEPGLDEDANHSKIVQYDAILMANHVILGIAEPFSVSPGYFDAKFPSL